MANNIRLGTNLKAILQAQGLSLKKISADTNIPYSTLHTWLENRQPKDICKVKVLCDYLRVDLDRLLFGEYTNGGDFTFSSGNGELGVTGGDGSARARLIVTEGGGVFGQLNGTLEGVYEVIVRRRSELE